MFSTYPTKVPIRGILGGSSTQVKLLVSEVTEYWSSSVDRLSSVTRFSGTYTYPFTQVRLRRDEPVHNFMIKVSTWNQIFVVSYKSSQTSETREWLNRRLSQRFNVQQRFLVRDRRVITTDWVSFNQITLTFSLRLDGGKK